MTYTPIHQTLKQLIITQTWEGLYVDAINRFITSWVCQCWVRNCKPILTGVQKWTGMVHFFIISLWHNSSIYLHSKSITITKLLFTLLFWMYLIFHQELLKTVVDNIHRGTQKLSLTLDIISTMGKGGTAQHK